MELLWKFGREAIFDVFKTVMILIAVIAFLFGVAFVQLSISGGGERLDHYKIERTADPRPPQTPNVFGAVSSAWIISQAESNYGYVRHARGPHPRL